MDRAPHPPSGRRASRLSQATPPVCDTGNATAPETPSERLRTALRDAVLFIENHAPDVHTHEPDEHIGNDCPVCDGRAIVGELRDLMRQAEEPVPRAQHVSYPEWASAPQHRDLAEGAL